MKWLYKLEYKYGKYYIPNLMTIVVGGMALVYLAQMMLQVNVYSLLSFSRALIFQGQVWRLITFVFVPGQTGILLLLMLFIYYQFGRMLEQNWGGFRFTLYYLIGILGAIIGGLLTGYASNNYLNMSLFLAFATLSPDSEFRLYFIIPIKGKWMIVFYAITTLLGVISAFLSGFIFGISALVSLVFSLLNYFLFFGRDLLNIVQDEVRIRRNRRNWNNRNR